MHIRPSWQYTTMPPPVGDDDDDDEDGDDYNHDDLMTNYKKHATNDLIRERRFNLLSNDGV